MQAFRAAQIQKSLIDGKRFDEGRQVTHHLPHFTTNANILFHVWLNDDGVGTGFQCLEHGHGRSHAMNAGKIAGRRYHAAFSAADDERFVPQFRIVAFFDRGVKRITINMRQRELIKLAVTEKARAAACMASSASVRFLRRKAVAAYTFFRTVRCNGVSHEDEPSDEHKRNILL